MKTIIFIIVSVLASKITGEIPLKVEILDELLTVKLDDGQGKIVGGIPAGSGDFPWQGLFFHDQGDGYASICGCSILNDHWVVTAAHCTQGATTSMVVIYLGITRISTRNVIGDMYTVSQILQHSDYNPEDFNNDISLLQLSEQIEMNQKVQPISLPLQGQNVVVGTECVISGWGTTAEDGSASDVLRFAEVPVLSNEQCGNWYGNNLGSSFPYNTQMCAGYELGGVDTCQGDSGGPLACRSAGGEYILQGITSFGIGCGRPYKPGVYTRVSEYVNWIDGFIGEGSGSEVTTTTPVITTTSDSNKIFPSAILFAITLLLNNVII